MINVMEIINSKTPNAMQRNWRIPSEFPNCPPTIDDEPLKVYQNNLKEGATFSKTTYFSNLAEHVVLQSVIHDNALIVMTENIKEAIKPFAVAKVTFENGVFVHESVSSYFMVDGAEKEFTLLQGKEWIGEDPFDDFC